MPALKPIATWAAVIGLITALAYAGGCSLDEIVHTDVPREVRAATGAPARVTLREARDLLADYDSQHQAGRDRLIREINDGEYLAQLGAAAVNSGLDIAIPAIGTVPGGAILTALLGGVAGYVTRRTPKAVLDAEYDLGRTEAMEAIKQAANVKTQPTD